MNSPEVKRKIPSYISKRNLPVASILFSYRFCSFIEMGFAIYFCFLFIQMIPLGPNTTIDWFMMYSQKIFTIFIEHWVQGAYTVNYAIKKIHFTESFSTSIDFRIENLFSFWYSITIIKEFTLNIIFLHLNIVLTEMKWIYFYATRLTNEWIIIICKFGKKTWNEGVSQIIF